ncbi:MULTISPECIES: LysE/ArgO family amino acid transporter [Pseudomonas]|jgi:L-lysine exporter family protein LysE/ArgO|uniref:Translocator protein, LysE family n=1 Tax=Pseudomonas veronii 1YdBTEX2 TaxID=1295141 RepID=A0A1D3K3I5_PSEVE|nr:MULTISPECIES: LysE family transporter [Pseudomonas]PMU92219.1 lysine transporter LysE [Pseudomonas sp. GW704-F3]PMU94514.1 lysine transporter LysE [Pseudomonas sp. GW704-F5]PMV03011.1 lysine transporter LysE [Pseudomonas sp. MPBD4-3]PMV34389.1 lysine transporter LysE [Pseudomonas sp. GW704-F2]SBW82842.1 translocator protein, LysE family [Pseudomonas veronii 1YdBTEX2]
MFLNFNALYLEGLLLGMGLFAAPGPKDTLVIRQGVGRGPIWAVVAICVLADVLLIAVGVAGLGSLLGSRPGVVALLLLSGAAYLLWFGGQRLLACLRNQSMPNTQGGHSQRGLLRTALVLGFANPYAWLDTVVLIGSIGAAKPTGQQALFASGAMTASLVWFVILALGCQRLTRLFQAPVVWRWLDAGVAVLMVYLAGMLITDSVSVFQQVIGVRL